MKLISKKKAVSVLNKTRGGKICRQRAQHTRRAGCIRWQTLENPHLKLKSKHNIHFRELCVTVGRISLDELVDDGALRPAPDQKSVKIPSRFTKGKWTCAGHEL